MVALHDRGRRAGRADRPAARPSDAEEVWRVLLAPLLRERPEAVHARRLRDAARTRAGPGLDAVRRLLTEADLEVLDRLVVRDGRWFAVDCADRVLSRRRARRSRPRPTPRPWPSSSALGIAPLPGRDVAGRARRRGPCAAPRPSRRPWSSEPGSGRTPGAVALVRRTPRSASRRCRAWAVAWALRRDGVAPPTRVVEDLGPTEVALLVRSLADLALRDGLVAWLCPGSLPLDCLAPDLVDALRCTVPHPTWHRGPATARPAIAGRRLLARLQSLVRAVPGRARGRRSSPCSPTSPGGRATVPSPGPAWTVRSALARLPAGAAARAHARPRGAPRAVPRARSTAGRGARGAERAGACAVGPGRRAGERLRPRADAADTRTVLLV